MTRVLLGFDARVAPASIPAWSTERRRIHLLAPEVETPLSVDPAVWPPFGEQTRSFLACGLSPSLPECTRDGAATIAVEWVRDRDERDAEHAVWSARVHPVDPPELVGAWSELGFDVVDVSGFSALMNTGFGERAASLGFVLEHIDRRTHLIEVLASARRLRDAADAFVPEHAPYAVVALHVLGDRP